MYTGDINFPKIDSESEIVICLQAIRLAQEYKLVEREKLISQDQFLQFFHSNLKLCTNTTNFFLLARHATQLQLDTCTSLFLSLVEKEKFWKSLVVVSFFNTFNVSHRSD